MFRPKPAELISTMLSQGNLLFWALATFLVVMLVRAAVRLTKLTTGGVQTRRRVRRNHGRVVSRMRSRPAVMLSAKTAKT